MSNAKRLQRWQKAGLIDQRTADNILAYEAKEQSGLTFVNSLVGVGAVAILLGVAAIISANWQHITVATKIGAHALVNLLLAGLIWKRIQEGKHGAVSEVM